MVSFRFTQLTFIALILFLATPSRSIRLFERRSDLVVPPVNASSWTVPLKGGKTCRASNGSKTNCTDTLMPPATSSVLQALAIGKGLFNYTCAGQSGDTAPTFDAQYTELYDAAPLIQVLPDQESFAALIPMVFSYNYGEMRNSTMNCMGTIGTLNSTAVITLYDIDTFEVTRSETLLAPDSPEKNAMWSHAYSADGTWEIYRVETFNGRPPATCIKPEDSIEIEYAAEYWFYRN